MVQLAFVSFCSLMIAGFTGYMVQVHTESSVYEVEHVVCLAVVSFLSLIVTMKLIPIVMAKCLVAGLFGRDINKAGDSKMYDMVPWCTHAASTRRLALPFATSLLLFLSLCLSQSLFVSQSLSLSLCFSLSLSISLSPPSLAAFSHSPGTLCVPKTKATFIGHH